MYYVKLYKNIDGKQSAELILRTKDKHAAQLAYEGTVMGQRYALKEKEYAERTEPDKIKFYKEDDYVSIVLKEEQENG